MRSMPGSARRAALEVLRRYNAGGGKASELLGSLLETTDRSGQATDLVYGVIRNTILLDRILAACGDVRKSRVKPVVRDILRMGVYELVYAPKTADYAIINEAVNGARHAGSQKAAGFVNAVLRSVQRQIIARDGAVQADGPMHAVPRADGGACVFGCAVLPDPRLHPAEHLHVAWSLPQWLVGRWISEYGFSGAVGICRASNRQPSVYAWPDIRRIDAESLGRRLAEEGVSCRVWSERGAVQLRGTGAMSGLASFREGLFYIQDPAAESLAAFFDPRPGDTVVDVCAAPGGKSIALALRMKDTGCLLASDVSDERLGRLEENIRRLGLRCVQCVPKTLLTAHAGARTRIDGVVLDVPCSNSGVLARRVEARGRLERGPEEAVLHVQRSLLDTACGLVSEGGKLLYSTCSILPEENEHQIQYFLRKHPDFSLICEKKTLPSAEKGDLFDHDGGYLALLTR